MDNEQKIKLLEQEITTLKNKLSQHAEVLTMFIKSGQGRGMNFSAHSDAYIKALKLED